MTKKYYQEHKAEIAEKKRLYQQTLEYKSRHRISELKYSRSKKGKEADRRFWKTEAGRAIQRRAGIQKLSTPEGRLKHCAVCSIGRDIRNGKIKRGPCVVCGDSKTQAHHYLGYARENWRNVQWLCPKHHKEAHALKLVRACE